MFNLSSDNPAVTEAWDGYHLFNFERLLHFITSNCRNVLSSPLQLYRQLTVSDSDVDELHENINLSIKPEVYVISSRQ